MAVLQIKASPGAQRNEICGFTPDGALKIKLNAAPEKGQANKELIEFLADFTNIKKQDITIRSGHTSRIKLVEFSGLDDDDLKALFAKV